MKKIRLITILLLTILHIAGANADALSDFKAMTEQNKAMSDMSKAIGVEDAKKVTEILHRNHYNINKSDEYGWSALLLAVQQGNYEIFNLILSDPTLEINETDLISGETGLMLAIKHKDIKMAKAILRHPNVDVSLKTFDGDDALYYARKNELAEITNLIERKLKGEIIDDESHQFLGLCRAGKNMNAIKLALKSETLHINFSSPKGVTPLIGATIEGHNSVVTLLTTSKKLNVNATDQGNWTALMYAAYFGRTEIAKELLSHPDIDIENTGKGGSTALKQAVDKGHNDIARLILTHPKAK